VGQRPNRASAAAAFGLPDAVSQNTVADRSRLDLPQSEQGRASRTGSDSLLATRTVVFAGLRARLVQAHPD